MDLISVIMPTYNAAKWVTCTLDNLAAQTYPHFELIVSDDGSQDDTVSVVRKKLAKGFKKPWQIIELGKNRGPSAARNLALKAAKGTWVQFLDSDDLMAPAKFEMQAAHCARVPADVSGVYSPWRQCYIDDGRVSFVGRLHKPDMEGRAPITCLGGRNRVLQGAGLTRRSVLEQIGGWDEGLRFWECEEVTFRIAKAGRLECVPSSLPLYLWRQHRNRAYYAHYEWVPISLGWIDLILKSLDYKSSAWSGYGPPRGRRCPARRAPGPLEEVTVGRVPRFDAPDVRVFVARHTKLRFAQLLPIVRCWDPWQPRK